jgi:hypothetical protein
MVGGGAIGAAGAFGATGTGSSTTPSQGPGNGQGCPVSVARAA